MVVTSITMVVIYRTPIMEMEEITTNTTIMLARIHIINSNSNSSSINNNTNSSSNRMSNNSLVLNDSEKI